MSRKILAAVLCLHLVRTVQAADWPMWRADAARSGYTSDELPDQLAMLWRRRAKRRPMPAWRDSSRLVFDRAYQPVIADGTLYFGSSADGKVYALDARTGTRRWEFFTDGPVRFAPAVWRDRVLVAGDDGWLVCLAADDGRLLWRLRGGPRDEMLLGNDRMISRWPARAGPVVADGVVYFGAGIWPSEGFYLYAVDAGSGEVLWCNDSSGGMEMDKPHSTARAQSGVAAQGYLALDGDALIVPTGRAVPAVFDRADGRFRYFHHQSNGKHGGSEVVAMDGRFFNRGVMFTTGDGAREYRLGTRLAAHPDLAIHAVGTRIMALDRQQLTVRRQTVDRKGKIITVKLPARPVWSFNLQHDVDGALIVAGNKVVAGGTNSVSVVTVNTSRTNQSLKTMWTTRVAGTACGLAVADGRLYVSTDRGNIYCFAARGQVASQIGHSAARWRGMASAHTPQRDDRQSPANHEATVFAAAAEEIVRLARVTKGFCVDLACGDGRLALELAKRSRLQIYAVDANPLNVKAARWRLDEAGLYGVRVTVHQAQPGNVPYPEWFADLVVSGQSVTDGEKVVLAETVRRMQRPYGGVACLGRPGRMSKSVRGPLEGAGSWTHLYSNAANTLCSDDTTLRGPLEMLWFRETDLLMPDRHGRGPAPLVDNGRMFVEGINGLRAVNIYNGRTLWEFLLEGILDPYHQEHLMGVAGTGSNFCLGGDRVYIAGGDRCLCLDAADGTKVAEWEAPVRSDGKPGSWGYLAWDNGTLFGSVANEQHLVKHRYRTSDMSRLFTESSLFFALDPHTGQRKWTYTPENSLRHNAIAIGNRRVYLIDRQLAPMDYIDFDKTKAETTGHRRGRLLALDAATGRVLWQTDEDVFGTLLALSTKHSILVMSYQPTRFKLPSELGGRMAAFSAGDGQRLWDVKARYTSRPILNDRTIYAQPGAWDLFSGRRLPFHLTRSYGCGISAGSSRLLVFRSATLGYLDLVDDQKTQNYGGIRPGCWVNAIPAGGLVLLADAASWCTCSYLNQATIALRPVANLPAPDAAVDE